MSDYDAIENSLKKLNTLLGNLMPLLTPGGALLGILLASFFMPFKPLVSWLFAFVTLVNSMGVSVRDFGKMVRHPKPLFLFMLTSYLIIPSLVSVIVKLLFSYSPDTVAGYVLLYSIPTAVTSCIWSGIFRGNAALSLTMLVIGTFLAPLSTPLTVRILTASDISIDTGGMVRSMMFMIVIPSIIGIAINAVTNGHCTDHAVPCLNPMTKLVNVLVMAINASQVAEDLIQALSPALIPELVTTVSIAFGAFFLSGFIARLGKLVREDAVSMVLASSMRNISAAMVIAISFFPPKAVIPVLLGIVIQQSACAIACHILFERKGN